MSEELGQCHCGGFLYNATPCCHGHPHAPKHEPDYITCDECEERVELSDCIPVCGSCGRSWAGEQFSAPWTLEQVQALNASQIDPQTHPFTCGDCEGHVPLVATSEGWLCPQNCGYFQEWAHKSQLEHGQLVLDRLAGADMSYAAENIRSIAERFKPGIPPILPLLLLALLLTACGGWQSYETGCPRHYTHLPLNCEECH